MNEQAQASFNGWAKVEVMGHQTHIGYVRTEVYGQAVMFRVDTPERTEREYTLTEPAYVNGSWTPAGAVVKRGAVPGCTALVGAGSIYRILPCDEAAALAAIESSQRAELKLISLPEGKQLGPILDRNYECCGGNSEDGHKPGCECDQEDEVLFVESRGA